MEDIVDLAGYLAEIQMYISAVKHPVNESLNRRIESLSRYQIPLSFVWASLMFSSKWHPTHC